MADPMRFLVLGGTSWLGGAVASRAVSRGHEVTCLARGESGAVPAGAAHVRADRRTPGAYAEVADRDWDAVLDVSWQPDQVRSALAALAPRAAHWVYVSSISVYADHAPVDGDESDQVLEPWSGSGEAGIEEYGGAKVSCETSCLEALGPHRVLVARAGLIVGYGDRSDRFGYWPARFARSREAEPVLVPPLDAPVQVVDVVDLARWLVAGAERGVAGTFDAVGPRQSFADVAEACSAVVGDSVALAEAGGGWLSGVGVEPWAGPESLPLWLPESYAGMVTRKASAARDAGLTTRPILETVRDSLRWEEELGLTRDRRAGLTPGREAELLTLLSSASR